MTCKHTYTVGCLHHNLIVLAMDIAGIRINSNKLLEYADLLKVHIYLDCFVVADSVIMNPMFPNTD